MHRIDTGTQVASFPAVPTQVGNPGFFTNGDPVTGTPATVLDASWFNTIQEEIANAIILLGNTNLDRNNNGQLAAAIAACVQFNKPRFVLADFATPGTTYWTVPAGVHQLEVWMVGGGGGGGASGAIGGGAGGGAGGYGWMIININPGDVFPITIGAGGAPSGSGTTQAQTGGSSSFGSFLTCYGGTGGMGGDVGSGTENAGGMGGLVLAAQGINAAGFQGQWGNDGSMENKAGTGVGGSSLFGPGGRASTTAGAGIPGGFGAGGGGCYGGNGYGGTGGPGFCMIRYFV